MDNSLYHPYINKDVKYVSGAAALNHYIYTVIGGLQNYHDEIGEEYIRAFVKEHSECLCWTKRSVGSTSLFIFVCPSRPSVIGLLL